MWKFCPKATFVGRTTMENFQFANSQWGQHAKVCSAMCCELSQDIICKKNQMKRMLKGWWGHSRPSQKLQRKWETSLNTVRQHRNKRNKGRKGFCMLLVHLMFQHETHKVKKEKNKNGNGTLIKEFSYQNMSIRFPCLVTALFDPMNKKYCKNNPKKCHDSFPLSFETWRNTLFLADFVVIQVCLLYSFIYFAEI